jgi:guanyl-specific ribonuclease Sa
MPAPSGTPTSLKAQLTRLAIFAVVLGLIWLGRRYGLIEDDKPAPPVAKSTPSATSTGTVAARPVPSVKPQSSHSNTSPAAADPLVVRNVTLRDQDGDTIYRGDVDLRPTLERIAAGKTLRFSHDGITFQNRERRLPQKSAGYYREWVVPTPGESGPGPQRLVTGEDGDVWYTADHYLSFRRVPYKLPALEGARDR